MKKVVPTLILVLLAAAGIEINAQTQPKEYLGLPGDNLNLYAVMDLFQKSATLEDFEKNLNDPENRINNLDLNGDGLVDYITVTDYVDGNVHNIVLQDPLTRDEKQDVAVFTVQRFPNESVQIQLIGDEALYGKNYIIEPIYDHAVATPNPGYAGNSRNVTVVTTTPVQVAAWPMMRFIYRPGYLGWHSSWYWGYYPTYWHPWSPFFWHYYYGYHQHYYPVYYQHYRHWSQPRYTRYNDFYYSHLRAHSPQVTVRINDGRYKTTYSHPEQRRQGVAYAKSHSDRTSTMSSGNSRRSSGGKNVSTKSNRSMDQNAGNSRRSNTTVTERKVSTTETSRSGKTASPARKSTSTTVSTTKSKSVKKESKAATRKDNKVKKADSDNKERR